MPVSKIETPVSELKPVPLLSSQDITNVAAHHTNTLLGAQQSAAGADAVTPRQRRVLSERQSFSDHFEVGIKNFKDGIFEIFTGTVGSVSEGKPIAKQQETLKISRAQINKSINSVRRYANNYANMNDFQRAVGGVDTFLDVIRPYKQNTPGTKAVSAVVGSLSLGSQWDNMGNLSRFMGTANSLVETGRAMGYKFPKNFNNALGLGNFGYAAHNLLNNWDRMTPEQRVVGTLYTLQSGAEAYQAGSALINAFSGSAPGGSLALGGGESTASEVFGNLIGDEALGSGLGTAVQFVGGALAAYNIIDQWGTGGAAGRANGAANGAALGYALTGLPVGAAIGAVIGLAIGSINAGKSSEQQKRDALRAQYVSQGLFQKEENGSVTIRQADGSVYDTGIDGSKGRAMNADGTVKTYANPDRIAERDKGNVLDGNELRPYDIDYTNDLDYIASLATKGANLFPVGGSGARKTREVDQMNGYLTNAATHGIGREFTEENFGAVMANVREYYKGMGITSAEQGLEAAKKMFEANRLSKDDYNAMVLGFEFAFSENFEQAQQLLTQLGRDKAPENVSAEEFERRREEDLSSVGV